MSKMSIVTKCAVALIVAGGVVAAAMAQSRREPYRADVRGFVLPAMQIISFDKTVGMLDTSTGAIYKLHGDAANPSTRKTWELRVPPVEGSTSGLLEIQRATFNDPDAIFLVDIIDGTTWVLQHRQERSRGESLNGRWSLVEIFR